MSCADAVAEAYVEHWGGAYVDADVVSVPVEVDEDVLDGPGPD